MTVNENDEIHFGNDVHLWRKVINSNTTKIFAGVGFTGIDELNSYAKELRCKLTTYKYKEKIRIEVRYFSFLDINIWSAEDFYNQIIALMHSY